MKPIAVNNSKSISAAVCTLGILFGVFVMPRHIAAAETQILRAILEKRQSCL